MLLNIIKIIPFEDQNCLTAKNYIIRFITQACSYGEFPILSSS